MSDVEHLRSVIVHQEKVIEIYGDMAHGMAMAFDDDDTLPAIRAATEKCVARLLAYHKEMGWVQ